MRAILNISLPADKKKALQERAKKAGKSVSAYVQYIIDLEQSMISEEELIEMSEQARKDYKDGKTEELGSLADLMD